MTRAALLPAGGDPFLNAVWLKHYARWADQVDELHMLVCGQTLAGPLEYIRSRAAELPNVILHEQPHRLDHGAALRFLIDWTEADHVLLCEDDAFVREPAAIGEAFARIEAGEVDIVGSPRTSASDEVAEAASRRFGPMPETRSGEVGHALWPAFLFARRADLLATDRWYGARRWLPGDTVPGLDYTVEREAAADTFVGTSWQLRAMGLRIRWEPQYRADIDKMRGWLPAPWFHVGSLSAGYGYLFCPESTGYFSDGSFERIAAHVRETGQYDWHKRMAFWALALDDGDGLGEHRAQYRAEMERFTVLAELDRDQIARWRETFREWVTW